MNQLIAPKFVYIGSFTSKERKGNGKGIRVCLIHPESGEWETVQTLELLNPSFLVTDHHQRFLYCVHGDDSIVSAFEIDTTNGHLQLISQVNSGGMNAVHLAVDATNRFLFTANFGSGSVTALPINEDGSLKPLVDLIVFQPGSPDPVSRPHHCVVDPAGQFLFVPDRGLDKVFIFRFDLAAGKFTAGNPPWISSPNGSGPRHICFHPSKSFAYVLNEFDSTLTAYKCDLQEGIMERIHSVSTLPSGYTGGNFGAGIAIAPTGDFVFVSNRGHNSVFMYAVDKTSGKLALTDWQLAKGENPRFITLDPSGNYLYVTNLDSNNIAAFGVDKDAGKLIPQGQPRETGSPSCLLLL